jgi:hypothetical protein
MKELKQMIIDFLSKEYHVEEATRQVNEAEIIIKGNHITVKYVNGNYDRFEIVITETLKLLK